MPWEYAFGQTSLELETECKMVDCVVYEPKNSYQSAQKPKSGHDRSLKVVKSPHLTGRTCVSTESHPKLRSQRYFPTRLIERVDPFLPKSREPTVESARRRNRDPCRGSEPQWTISQSPAEIRANLAPKLRESRENAIAATGTRCSQRKTG